MRVRRSFVVSSYIVALAGMARVAAAQQPAAVVPAAPTLPGLNGQLTPWLQLRGELRTRIEEFTGGGFTPGNDDAYWMDRFRLNATVKASKSVSFFAQVQDARPRLFGEYNVASGDENRSDGTRGTFDQLYPTGHDKLGLSDQVGWRNIRHARSGLEFKPARKWQATGSYHSWWLASATDGLHNAVGALVTRSPTGTAGTRVGQELDAQATYVYSPQLQINGGFAHVFPGEFLKTTTGGHSPSWATAPHPPNPRPRTRSLRARPPARQGRQARRRSSVSCRRSRTDP